MFLSTLAVAFIKPTLMLHQRGLDLGEEGNALLTACMSHWYEGLQANNYSAATLSEEATALLSYIERRTFLLVWKSSEE